jgi:hypothetical protein
MDSRAHFPARINLRFAVIERLQTVIRAASPGTPLFDEADAAISLALKAKRSVSQPEFFERNVRRDARRILRRRRRVVVFSALGPDDLSSRERGVPMAEILGPAKTARPDSECIARELARGIETRIRHIRDACACFDAMREGEQPADTARRLSIPERRVHYLRSQIRKAARDLLSA